MDVFRMEQNMKGKIATGQELGGHKSRMYEDWKTWQPFLGCEFHCKYCRPSFQRLVNRIYHQRGKVCDGCGKFAPHEHPDRLQAIPSAKQIWPCAHGDISFARPAYIRQVIEITKCFPNRLFQWQSKNPACFNKYLTEFPQNTILLTTLETNRDEGYSAISKAPAPSHRANAFAALDWPRKRITIEPIMDFDADKFLKMILKIDPEAVWIGYNSHPKSVPLPEPTRDKTLEFIELMKAEGIQVKIKLMR